MGRVFDLTFKDHLSSTQVIQYGSRSGFPYINLLTPLPRQFCVLSPKKMLPVNVYNRKKWEFYMKLQTPSRPYPNERCTEKPLEIIKRKNVKGITKSLFYQEMIATISNVYTKEQVNVLSDCHSRLMTIFRHSCNFHVILK